VEPDAVGEDAEADGGAPAELAVVVVGAVVVGAGEPAVDALVAALPAPDPLVELEHAPSVRAAPAARARDRTRFNITPRVAASRRLLGDVVHPARLGPWPTPRSPPPCSTAPGG
jgi:hypothetical protein